MKKKVRIYKSQNGEGAYINKTAKFLKKAQEGGMPDVDAMGYPSGGQQAQQPTSDEITQSIVADISNGRPKEETVVRLVQVLGQDPMQTAQYYDQIYAALEEQQNQAEEEAEDSDKPSDYSAQEAEANNAPIDEIEDEWNSTNNQDLSNEIVSEDDDVDYGDDDQVASDIIMQFGGAQHVYAQRMDEGGVPIQFPGIDAYLPSSMGDIFYGDTDYLTKQAWSPNAEASAGIEPEETPQEDYKLGGDYKKNKRIYVNSMMKLAKKQLGGEDMSKSGDTDPRGEDVRKQRLNSFIGTVKNEAQLAKAKEQAEEQFDQMMQQQQQQMQMPQQYPMEQPMAQFGMQMGRGFFGRPRMPRGVGFGYGLPISKIDVRKSGIFGRPKQYSIEFAQGAGMAGYPGYGTTGTTIKKSKGRIVTETIASTVNNKSTEDVAKSTNSNAANTSAQNWDKDNNGIPDSIQANPPAANPNAFDTSSWLTNPNATATNTVPGSGVVSNNPTTPGTTANNIQQNTANSNSRSPVNVNNEVEDAVINNSNEKRNLEESKNKVQEIVESLIRPAQKKDQWGRPASSKWYGFDPKKGKKYVPGYYDKAKLYADVAYHSILPGGVKNVVNLVSRGYNALPDMPNLSFSNSSLAKRANQLKKERGYKQEGGQQYYNPFGGFVDSDNPNLYKFIYGGDDAYFTQGDLDDVYSKDTSDPYFQFGGLTRYDDKGQTDENKKFDYTVSAPNKSTTQLSPYEQYRKQIGDKLNMSLRDDLSAQEMFELAQKAGINNSQSTEKKKTTATTQNQNQGYNQGIDYNGFNMFGNFFPANLGSYAGTWSKVKRGPYNMQGQAIPGYAFGPNTQIASVDVKRSGWLSGRPKKYTVNYINPGMNVTKKGTTSTDAAATTTAPGTTAQTNTQTGTNTQPTTTTTNPQGTGSIYSNTEGLSGKARREIRRGERRTAREVEKGMEEFPENPNYPQLTDQEEQAKFQQQQRKNGKMWDKEKEAWVDAPQIGKMEIKKPGEIAHTKDIQAQINKDASEKAFGEYGDIATETGVNPEVYKDVYQRQGREAADKMMDETFARRNENIQKMEEYKAANPDYARQQDELNNPELQKLNQDYSNSMDQQYMEDLGIGNLYQAPTAEGNQPQSNQPSQSFEGYPFGEEPEADESFDKGYFGQNQFRNYDILQRQQAAAKAKLDAQRKAKQQQQQSSNRQSQSSDQVQNRSSNDSNAYNDSLINLANRGTLAPEEKQEYKRTADVIAQEQLNKSRIKTLPGSGAYGEDAYNVRQRAKQTAKSPEALERKKMDSEIDKSADARDKKIQQINNRNISDSEKKRLIEIENEKHINNYNNISAKYEKSNRLSTRQFGGDLQRFIPQALYGNETPVTNEGNPAVGDIPRMKMQSAKDAGQQLMMNSRDKVTEDVNTDPQTFSVDYKAKDMYGMSGEGIALTKNALMEGAAGMLGRIGNKKSEAEMYKNLTADNLYAADPSRDRGDYDVNSGLYRPNEMGQTWNSRSKQLGGEPDPYEMAYPNAPEDNMWYPGVDTDYMNFPVLNQDILDRYYRNQSPMPMEEELPEEAYMYQAQLGGTMDFYDEGDEVYMTEDELNDFLKKGGQVEYL
jgi:hypothetical protein